MSSPVFRHTLFWLVAMVPGILFGRYMKGRVDSKHQTVPVKAAALISREDTHGSGDREMPSGELAESLSEEEFLRVPPSAMRRIELRLLEGIELNKNECRLLGLDEEAIGRLSAVVDQAMDHWREREKATMRWLPSAGSHKLIYIPPADPELSEQEWKDLTATVREIGGPGLGELLDFNLTDGHSPSRFSNWGKGMLNVTTGGFGTMHRFIKVSPLPDGSWSYDGVDVLPETLRNAGIGEIDASVFETIVKSHDADERNTYNSVKDHGRLSHLPLPNKP